MKERKLNVRLNNGKSFEISNFEIKQDKEYILLTAFHVSNSINVMGFGDLEQHCSVSRSESKFSKKDFKLKGNTLTQL